ncbi:protein Wnt-2 [Scaptodrosophila lebanonensis]|uniref:Protein Wnt n=1 Tax=Drosophila lebanonensis TaxID=7225 RepID=A0A6J2UG87_DROLE|nr:protein Wnt-2 [Scaptodrosophila lebanonensis]
MWKIHNKLLIYLLWIMEIRLVSSFVQSSKLCGRIPGLTPPQRQLCGETPDALIALGEGYQLGAHECQYQFRGHRWNCTQVWQRNVFAHVMHIASREAAYAYAIASAGAAYAVTAACARGNITMCGCDVRHKAAETTASTKVAAAGGASQPAEPWKWGGCSADVDFGMRFARKFMDARELEHDARSLMNLHNNRAGRTLVKKLLRTDCKCHGVSGSCVMKTCWKSLPPFRLIGDRLMQKYHKAKTVHAIRGKRGLKLVLSRRKHAAQKSQPSWPKRMELVYLQPSPNYCERSVQMGTLGTVGRLCNHTAHGPQSCDLLCCGRGYNTQQIRRSRQCRCQFRWCCQVECDACEESYEEFTCK